MIELLAVIERDLKKTLRNPIILIVCILLPVANLVVLGDAFQGELKTTPMGVVNHDTGPHSKDIIDNLMAIQAGPEALEITFENTDGVCIEGVRNGEYKACLIIPENYSKKVIQRRRPEVGLFFDNTDAISAGSIRVKVNSAVMASNLNYVSIREDVDKTIVRNINLYKKVDYKQSLIPGIVIMAIYIVALTSGSFNLLQDRFLGVDESYMITPLSRANVVLGLLLSGLLISSGVAAIVLTISFVICGLSMISNISQLILLLFVIFLISLNLLSLLSAILSRSNDPGGVPAMSSFLSLILFFSSGAAYPVESFPAWLKLVSKINPQTYAVDAFKAILFKNAGLFAISEDIAILLFSNCILMVIAFLSFKRTVSFE